jgi:hypothetical protein
MAFGPGKYDDELTDVRTKTQAAGRTAIDFRRDEKEAVSPHNSRWN